MVDPLKIFWVLTNSTYLVTKFIRLDPNEKNINAPYFDKLVYETFVDENEDINHTVLVVTAKDFDAGARIRYEIAGGNVADAFAVENVTGAIYVAGGLDYERRKRYDLRVAASNSQRENYTTVVIHVRDLNDNPPVFERPTYRAQIAEEDGGDLPRRIMQVAATDGDTDRPQHVVYFLTGQGIDAENASNSKFDINRTSGEIFVLNKLDRDPPLGRPQWRFTVFAQDENGEGLVGYADVQVNLRDINDNAPSFPLLVYEGNITENGASGVTVMSVSAVDYDDPLEGSNAVISYSIEKNVIEEGSGNSIFEIEPATGVIKTAVCCLDREKTSDYSIQIVAVDGGGLKGTGSVSITVIDVNDMGPRFTKQEWFVEVDEGADSDDLKNILTVTALDDDEPASNEFFYKVLESSGYGADRFAIVTNPNGSGTLRNVKDLDYEDPAQRQGFRFKIMVSDQGPRFRKKDNYKKHLAYSWVNIKLRDINDNYPLFEQSTLKTSVLEDIPIGTSIGRVRAIDPDESGYSKVNYVIERRSDRQRQFTIDQVGVVRTVRHLDRETTPVHGLRIFGIDDGVPPKTSTTTLIVTVEDVNDNGPRFLKDYTAVIYEGVGVDKRQGIPVIELEATDDDDPSKGNCSPFYFSLDAAADKSIVESFRVHQDYTSGRVAVTALKSFDREEHKQYLVPIVIKDSGVPSMTATSTLTVVIGDVNDNKMEPGEKHIQVNLYNAQNQAQNNAAIGQNQEIVIGRVHVQDLDDWDLPDKRFHWNQAEHYLFKLNATSGEIRMKVGALGTHPSSYELFFKVNDVKHGQIDVPAKVNINILVVTEDMVRNHGSVRLSGVSAQEFIENWKESKLDKFQNVLCKLFHVPDEDVHILSVQSKNDYFKITDVRFSVKSVDSVRLNGVVLINRNVIEEEVNVDVIMVNIDECLKESERCDNLCISKLDISALPRLVDANQTALVGVGFDPHATCAQCIAYVNDHEVETFKDKNLVNYNKVTCDEDQCNCPEASGTSTRAASCPILSRTFTGDSWAWFKTLETARSDCEASHLHFEFVTGEPDGLMLYNGPITAPFSKDHANLIADFISVELSQGHPRLLIDYGSGTLELMLWEGKTLDDNAWHRLDIFYAKDTVRMVLDFCKPGVITEDGDSFNSTRCLVQGTMPPYKEHLNLNTPLQLGGLHTNHFDYLSYKWSHVPSTKGLTGCIRNLYHNAFLYDLGTASWSHNSAPGCSSFLSTKEFKKAKNHSPATFKNQSFIKYSLDFDLDKFQTHIHMRFRTRQLNGELFRMSDQRGKEYMVLELKNGCVLFRFCSDPSKREVELTLRAARVSDGEWHAVQVSRYGSTATLQADGGEGRLYNATFQFEGDQFLHVDKAEGVYVGGRVASTGAQSYDVLNDFRDGCIDDVRLNGRQLPLPPAANGTHWGRVALTTNVVQDCASSDPCKAVTCPGPFECLDVWNAYECGCPDGQVAFADARGHVACVDPVHACVELPCLNGGTCVARPRLRHRCACAMGYRGERCELIQEGRALELSIGAFAAVLACLLAILVLALVFVTCSRRREARRKPNKNEDVRENIINYDEEGGGEDDMTAFDITPLQIPIDCGADEHQTQPGTLARTQSRHPADVEGLLRDMMGRHDEDAATMDSTAFDDLRNYAFEGEGSVAGSLSLQSFSSDDG